MMCRFRLPRIATERRWRANEANEMDEGSLMRHRAVEAGEDGLTERKSESCSQVKNLPRMWLTDWRSFLMSPSDKASEESGRTKGSLLVNVWGNFPVSGSSETFPEEASIRLLFHLIDYSALTTDNIFISYLARAFASHARERLSLSLPLPPLAATWTNAKRILSTFHLQHEKHSLSHHHYDN